MSPDQVKVDAFTDFVACNEARIRRALTAAFGPDVGVDAAADAFAYGWQHWDRVSGMENPVGYLYRVGFNAARSTRRSGSWIGLESVASDTPWVEPGLVPALEQLSDQQRVIVALVHAHEWTLGEVADLLGISKGSVQTHLKRAMKRLRRGLGVK